MYQECSSQKRPGQKRPGQKISDIQSGNRTWNPTPPEHRVREAAIFEVVEVDLAGPLQLTDSTKVWIALYIYAIYRAIDLEIVKSLSTECFI